MDLTKHFLNETFDKTLELYSDKITALPNIKLKYIDKEFFINFAKKDVLIQKQIEYGFYKDFEKEYPNFLVVFVFDKIPLSLLINDSYKVSICFDIAKEKLKNFSTVEVRDYLIHSFAHEITHIIEDDLKKERRDLWELALKNCKGNERLANEELAEDIADMIMNNSNCKRVYGELWGVILNRIKNIRKHL